MNEIAALPAFLFGIATLLFIFGIKNLTKKEINTSKFKAFHNYQEEEEYKRYEKLLKKSKVPFKTAITLIVLGGVGIGFITYIVVGVVWIALLSFAGGFYIPSVWYKWHIESNKKAMIKQMELASEIIASVLKSQSSITDALQRASVDLKDPLKTELMQTATKIKLGVPLNEAFAELTGKVNIREMQAVSISISLQQKEGISVNIPNLFLQLQHDIRKKVQFKKEISAETANIRTAGLIVAAVPFATITFMRCGSPEFTEPLFNNPVGLLIFSVCIFTIFIGLKWMFKMTKLEI